MRLLGRARGPGVRVRRHVLPALRRRRSARLESLPGDEQEPNHNRLEYTDAIWAYWSKDVDRWNPAHKAVVLDGSNCTWSKRCIGLPSVVRVGKRLAMLYDAPGGESLSHMGRHVGLAWLELPLEPPRP